MWRSCSRSAVSTFRTKPSGAGCRSLGPLSRGGFDASALDQAHGGIWTKWSSALATIGCVRGARSTTRAKFSTFRCSGGGPRRRLGSSCAGLLKKQGFAPSVVVTDKLRSYASAFRDIALSARHEQGLKKEQSGRELTPASPATDAKAAAVQVTGIRSTLSLAPMPPFTTPSTCRAISSPAARCAPSEPRRSSSGMPR